MINFKKRSINQTKTLFLKLKEMPVEKVRRKLKMPWHLDEDRRAGGPRGDSPIDPETIRLSENLGRNWSMRTKERILKSLKEKYEKYHYHNLMAAAEVVTKPECRLLWQVRKTIWFVLGERSATLDLPDLFEVFVNLENKELHAFFRKIICRKIGKTMNPKMLALAAISLCYSRIDFKSGADPRAKILNELAAENEL